MPGRNSLKNWLNKNIPVYFRELFDVLLSYTNKGRKPLIINSAEDGIEEGSFSLEAFDAKRNEGFGEIAVATGDGNRYITSALVPFLDTAGKLRIYLNGAAEEFEASSVGIGTYLANHTDAGDYEGDLGINTSNGVFSSNLADYADVSTGFYWICFPGPTGGVGSSWKFWYDRQKIFSILPTIALSGESWDRCWIDQSGCLFYGDYNYKKGRLISWPTFEDGHGLNAFNLYFNNAGGSFGGDTTIPISNNASDVGIYFGTTKIGSAGAVDSSLSVATASVVNGSKIKIVSESSGYWNSFSDRSSGFYEITVPHRVDSRDSRGSSIRYYWDKTKVQNAFWHDTSDMYIDQLGSIWKGDPESGGEYVCGAYESSHIFDVRHTKLKVSSNDSTEDYLLSKLDETENVKLIEKNDGGNESIEIKAPKLPNWDSTYSYSSDEYVVYSGTIYKSLQNSNLNKNPASETSWWSQLTTGGGIGAEGTIASGETETTITFTNEAGNYNRAVVSTVGINGGQRQPFIKVAPYDDGLDLKVDVAIDSAYTEDIDVHVVLANE